MDEKATRLSQHQLAVERDYRRNVSAFVGWEALWGLGMPFAMVAVFSPAYLRAMGASRTLIGVVLAFPVLFTPLQLLVGYWVPPRLRLQAVRWGHIAGVAPWLLYSLAAAHWGGTWPATLHIGLYVFVQALFVGILVSLLPSYWEIMTDNIPERRRGRLMGLRSAGIGGAGLLVGFLARRALAHWETPRNFQICFIIGTSIYLGSCAILWLVRDHMHPLHSNGEGESPPVLRVYLKNMLRHIWAEPNYRIFLFFYAMILVAVRASSFIIVASADRLHATAQQQGAFGLVFLGTTAGLGWTVGWLADRYGYRLTGCAVACLMASAFITLLTTQELRWWYVAYGATTLGQISVLMLLCNMSTELCPTIRRGPLMSVGNCLILPLVVTATTLGGVVVDVSGSYDFVFVACAVLSVVAVLGFAFIVREPRTGRLYMVKMIPQR